MNLVLKSNEFLHIKETSVYNHNFFRYVGKDANHGFDIEEICHEDYNFYEYWIIDYGNVRMFLGCSRFDAGIHGNAIVNIDFREFYT